MNLRGRTARNLAGTLAMLAGVLLIPLGPLALNAALPAQRLLSAYDLIWRGAYGLTGARYYAEHPNT
jgi:hypothetical protein